ncbi:MAG: chemotaxis protein CheW [Deltaproteobacteria bacterium]|nr:chemotaxis protein CheW [Deltaproteobacteria bacterium]
MLNKEILEIFLCEARELIQSMETGLLTLETQPDDRDIINAVFRAVHTLKGNTAFLGGMDRLVGFFHAQENLLDLIRKGTRRLTPPMISLLLTSVDILKDSFRNLASEKPWYDGSVSEIIEKLSDQFKLSEADSASPIGVHPGMAHESFKDHKPEIRSGHETIRVNIHLIDRLINLAGELVLNRNRIRLLLQDQAEKIPGLALLLQHVNHITSGLQERILKMRLQPLDNVLNKLPRIVRDLSVQNEKAIELTITGGDVVMDKSILDNLSGPLTALIGFCVTGGIENPETRVKLGKPAAGRISVQAIHEQGRVLLRITDDGQGLDPEKVIQRTFSPALNSRESTTNQGPNEVKLLVEELGGSFQYENIPLRGATFSLSLPLTLAIISALIIRAGGQTFAIPQQDIMETVCIPGGEGEGRVEKIGRSPVMRLRNRLLPLVNLTGLLAFGGKPGRDDQTDVNIVVLRCGPNRYGLIVDRIMDIEEIVVKPLSRHFAGNRLFSGAAIMGDGSVALILNSAGLTGLAKLNFLEMAVEDQDSHENDSLAARKPFVQRQTILLFNHARDELFAVPLSSILRLEVADFRAVERFGGRECLPYRGASLPLIRLNNHLPVGPLTQSEKQFFTIIPRTEGAPVGIMASRLVDILDAEIDEMDNPFSWLGIKGSAIVDDRLVLLLDLPELIHLWEQSPRPD